MNKHLLFKIEYQKTELTSKITPLFEELLRSGEIFLFSGHVGSGKTFLIKKLLSKLFSVKNITSPTYSYVKKYKGFSAVGITHFDLYRLKTMEEFCDLGFWQELFEPKEIIFVEWPEILFPYLNEILRDKTIYLIELSANKNNFVKYRELKVFQLA